MKKSIILATLLALLPMQTVWAKTPTQSAQEQTANAHAFPAATQKRVEQAAALLQQHQADKALPLLNQSVSEANAALKKIKGQKVWVSNDATHTLQLLIEAAHKQKNTIVLKEEWIMPLYLRAYAYIELKQFDKAKRDLDAALKLAPLNPRILGERGQLALMQKNWTEAEHYFKQQQQAAQIMQNQEMAIEYQGFALRGQGYIAVERQQWDAAERYYQQALKLNPADKKSMAELRFVQQNRSK